MAVPEKKVTLTDVGTRYKHLTDLQDIWGTGLIAITNSMEKFATPKDKTRKAALESAINLLEAYMAKLADYDSKQHALRTEITKIPLNKWRETDAQTPKEESLGSGGLEPQAA